MIVKQRSDDLLKMNVDNWNWMSNYATPSQVGHCSVKNKQGFLSYYYVLTLNCSMSANWSPDKYIVMVYC